MSKSKHRVLTATILISFMAIQVFGGYASLIAWKEAKATALRDAKAALTNELSHLDVLMRNELWSVEERERYFRLKIEIAKKHKKKETASAYAMFIISRFDYPSAGKKFKE